jgi:tetratricopeptide (TPR) repeat protein
MTILPQFDLFPGLVLLLTLVSPAPAQSQFSKAGAQAIINTQDWNRLLAYGQAWTRAEPNNADAWYVVGRAYGSKYYNIGLGRPADAVQAYQRAVQLNPQLKEGWEMIGLTDEELGQWSGSAAALQHVLQMDPQQTNAWDFLCSAYIHLHQFQQAAEAVDNLEKNAKTATDWFQAGTDYYAVAPYYQPTPMYQKSKAAFQKSLQLNPQNGAAWTNLGTTEQALGNTNDAFADYQKGAQLGNKQGAVNNANLAADIQACMIQRNSLLNQKGEIPGMAFTSYNNRCAQYTGEIKLKIVP